MVSGSDIRWIVCESFALCSRQAATPARHHEVSTDWMIFLTPDH